MNGASSMRLALPRRLPKAVAVHRAARRSLHTPLPLSSLSFNVDAGLKPFLSPATTRMLAVEWQEGLLDRLNEYVAGTESEGKTLFDTIVDLSKDRTQVVPFNLASEALNNSFFLNCLQTPTGQRQTPAPGSRLSANIESTYGSLTQFISYFSSAAMGMFSSGYVWLTCDQHANLGVCATYGAGTILVQNRQQRGDWGTLLVPAPTEGELPGLSGGSSRGAPSLSRTFSSSARTLASDRGGLPEDGEDAAAAPAQPHGASFADSLFDSSAPPPPSYASGRTIQGKAAHRFSTLYPLLGLQVAERAYLQDYGVWGREAYVRNFWQCVNWKRIESEYERRAQAGVRTGMRSL